MERRSGENPAATRGVHWQHDPQTMAGVGNDMVYIEDSSFGQAYTPHAHASIVAWKRDLEESEGRYNADAAHVCTLKCTERGNVKLLDLRNAIYGCRMSGKLHRCGPDERARMHTCTVRTLTNWNGEKCAFSGRTIMPDRGETLDFENPYSTFSKFTDTTIERSRSGKNLLGGIKTTKIGESKYSSPASPVQETARRRAAERTGRANRSMDAFYDRRHKSSKESARSQRQKKLRDDLTQWLREKPFITTAEVISHGSMLDARRDEILAKRREKEKRARAHATGGRESRAYKRRKLGNGLDIQPGTYNRIRACVRDLLEKSSDIRKLLGCAPLPWKGKALADVCVRYTKRCANIYALVQSTKHVSVTAIETSRTKTPNRTHGQRSTVEGFALAALKMIADGITLNGAVCVLTGDRTLQKLIPTDQQLPWFGLDVGLAGELLRQDRTPPPQSSKYTYKKRTEASRDIRMAMRNFSGSATELRRVLNLD